MDKIALLQSLDRVKYNEKILKNERLDIESKLLEIYKVEAGKKSQTFKDGDFKLSIKKNEVYKLDQKGYSSARVNIQLDLLPEKIKYDLDVKKYENLKAGFPDLYKELSSFVTYKENNPTLTIEQIK